MEQNLVSRSMNITKEKLPSRSPPLIFYLCGLLAVDSRSEWQRHRIWVDHWEWCGPHYTLLGPSIPSTIHPQKSAVKLSIQVYSVRQTQRRLKPWEADTTCGGGERGGGKRGGGKRGGGGGKRGGGKRGGEERRGGERRGGGEREEDVEEGRGRGYKVWGGCGRREGGIHNVGRGDERGKNKIEKALGKMALCGVSKLWTGLIGVIYARCVGKRGRAKWWGNIAYTSRSTDYVTVMMWR